MNRARSNHTAAGIAMAIFAAVSPQTADALTLTRYPSVWLRTTSSIRIYWQTNVAGSGKVLYGDTPLLGQEATHPGTSADHAVDLTGLSPGAFYYYRVVSDTDTLTDGSDRFRTAPIQPEPFRFVAFGDLGSATTPQKQLAARIDTLGANLAILTGDIIYELGEAANFTPQYFNIYRPTIARIPFYPSLGNHDVATAGGQPYIDAFHLPSAPSPAPPERYYSFDYGNAHFAALEVTLENTPPSAAMLSWLSADLAATTQFWKFVYFHVPMYSNEGVHGGDPTIAAAVDDILETNGVDVVFQGHNHFYTRTYPIVDGLAVDQEQNPAYLNPAGPIYIVTGGGGKTLYGLVAPTPLEVFSLSAYHVTSVDVIGSTLQLRAIGLDGAIFDSMSLTKATVTAGPSETSGGPYRFAAGKPRPNPSKNESDIPFTLDRESKVTVTIHDVAGRLVRVLDSPGPMGPGPGSLRWDGRDSRGLSTATGLYFLSIRSGSRTVHERLMRLR
jgi:3',5'-cyclic AMP phosphodiesterase CpdA